MSELTQESDSPPGDGSSITNGTHSVVKSETQPQLSEEAVAPALTSQMEVGSGTGTLGDMPYQTPADSAC